MKTTSLKGMLFLLGILVFYSCSKDSTVSNEQTLTPDVTYNYSSFEIDVLNEINRVRSEHGLSILEFFDLASFQALEHNDHMLEMDEICHHNFDDRKRVIQNSSSATGVGENIAHGTATAETVVQA
mgnify:CR=1 FL=1